MWVKEWEERERGRERERQRGGESEREKARELLFVGDDEVEDPIVDPGETENEFEPDQPGLIQDWVISIVRDDGSLVQKQEARD